MKRHFTVGYTCILFMVCCSGAGLAAFWLVALIRALAGYSTTLAITCGVGWSDVFWAAVGCAAGTWALATLYRATGDAVDESLDSVGTDDPQLDITRVTIHGVMSGVMSSPAPPVHRDGGEALGVTVFSAPSTERRASVS